MTKAPVIDTKKCSGCGRCVAACPDHLISLEIDGYRKHAVRHHEDRCLSCRACAVCPIHALSSAPEADGTDSEDR